jgi:hypothetical protein
MENASRAFLDAVRKSMRQIRSVIGATIIDPELLTAAERLQYEGYLRREETNAAILALSKGGASIKQIVRQTGYSRKLVRQVIRGERHDVFRTRQSSLDPYLPWLDDQWASPQGAGLPGLTSCRWRVDNSSTAIRKGRCRKSSPDPIGQNNRPSYDGRTGYALEGRNHHRRRRRSWRYHPGRGSRDRR